MTSNKDEMPRIYYHSGLHPITESMVKEPPPGFHYTSNVKPSVFSEYTKPPTYQSSRKILRTLAYGVYGPLGVPRLIPIFKDCDLIHLDGCMLPITTRPWIVGNVEYSGGFFSFDDRWYTRGWSRSLLGNLLRNTRCKKILTLSEAALESLRLGLGRAFETIRWKTDVLYPAVPSEYPARTMRSTRSEDPLRILFVGNHFFDKGGREVFYAFRRLRKRYDVELSLVTSVPRHHWEYFEDFKKKIELEPGVTLRSNVPKSVLWDEFFLRSHIFCFPSYMETFGYVILEAMAGGLAVVASDEYAIPEIIKDGLNGMLVHAPCTSFARGALRSTESLVAYRRTILDERVFSPVVDSLENALATLIEDGTLRRRLAREGFKEVTEGRFSVPARNRKLAGIYDEALQE